VVEPVKYNHAEAFAVMLYEGQVTKRIVTIWNSRDGVTPFLVDIDGELFQHIMWKADRCAPDHKLAPGELFFRDTSPEDAKQAATQVVDKCWPELKGARREKRIAELVPQMLEQGGSRQPWLGRAPLVEEGKRAP